MSVVALANRPVRGERRPVPPGAGLLPHRPPGAPGSSQAMSPLNVTIDVTLPAGAADASVIAVIDALREAIEQIVHHPPYDDHDLDIVAHLDDTLSGPAHQDGTVGGDPGVLQILPEERAVWYGSEEIRLTRLEFDLLLFFAWHPRRAFSRVQLMQAIWGHAQGSGRTVDVHVRRLRAKFDDVVPLLTTIRGVGYRLDNDARIAVIS